jgi:hypothetical protein
MTSLSLTQMTPGVVPADDSPWPRGRRHDYVAALLEVKR